MLSLSWFPSIGYFPLSWSWSLLSTLFMPHSIFPSLPIIPFPAPLLSFLFRPIVGDHSKYHLPPSKPLPSNKQHTQLRHTPFYSIHATKRVAPSVVHNATPRVTPHVVQHPPMRSASPVTPSLWVAAEWLRDRLTSMATRFGGARSTKTKVNNIKLTRKEAKLSTTKNGNNIKLTKTQHEKRQNRQLKQKSITSTSVGLKVGKNKMSIKVTSVSEEGSWMINDEWFKIYDIYFDMIWYDLIWYNMIWYDMIWFDMIWYDMIRWCDIPPLCLIYE